MFAFKTHQKLLLLQLGKRKVGRLIMRSLGESFTPRGLPATWDSPQLQYQPAVYQSFPQPPPSPSKYNPQTLKGVQPLRPRGVPLIFPVRHYAGGFGFMALSVLMGIWVLALTTSGSQNALGSVWPRRSRSKHHIKKMTLHVSQKASPVEGFP